MSFLKGLGDSISRAGQVLGSAVESADKHIDSAWSATKEVGSNVVATVAEAPQTTKAFYKKQASSISDYFDNSRLGNPSDEVTEDRKAVAAARRNLGAKDAAYQRSKVAYEKVMKIGIGDRNLLWGQGKAEMRKFIDGRLGGYDVLIRAHKNDAAAVRAYESERDLFKLARGYEAATKARSEAKATYEDAMRELEFDVGGRLSDLGIASAVLR